MEKVKNYRPLVYICSPYAGDTGKNAENARRYCRFAVNRNGIPIALHLLFPQFMDEETERENALFMGIVLLGKCDEVWVFGDTISSGMRQEIAKAEAFKKKVRYFSEEVVSCS